jgi:hypothetical protein
MSKDWTVEDLISKAKEHQGGNIDTFFRKYKDKAAPLLDRLTLADETRIREALEPKVEPQRMATPISNEEMQRKYGKPKSSGLGGFLFGSPMEARRVLEEGAKMAESDPYTPKPMSLSEARRVLEEGAEMARNDPYTNVGKEKDFPDPAPVAPMVDPSEERRRQALAAALAMPNTMRMGASSRTTQTISGPKPSAELQQKREGLVSAYQIALQQKAQDIQNVSNELKARNLEYETRLANAKAEGASKEARINANLMSIESARSDALEEYEAKQQSFDPKRFWKNRTFADNAIAVLGAALGGAAEALTGGKVKSRMVDIVMRLADKDVNAQLAEIRLAKGKYELKDNLVDYYTKRLGSAKLATLQAKRDIVMDMQRMAGQLEMDARTIDQKFAAKELGIRLQMKNIDLQQEQFMAQQGKKIVTRGYSSRDVANAPKAAMLKAAMVGEKGEEMPKGMRGEFQAKIDALNQINDLERSYTKLKPYKYSAWGAFQDSAKYRADLIRTSAKYVRAISGAQATDKERKILKEAFAQGLGPGEFSREQGYYKLGKMREEIAKELATRVHAYPSELRKIPPNLRPIVYKYMRSARGVGRTPTPGAKKTD